MSKKNNYYNLYVAFEVYDHEVETEMYEQYVTFGTIEHRIYVGPKKRLIYSRLNEENEEVFYDYKTDKRVYENSYTSSFETSSSPMRSLYCGYTNGKFPIPFKDLRDEFKKEYKEKMNAVGYFIPLDEYINEKFGFNIPLLTPAIIDKLIRLINIGSHKSVILSMDPEEAKLQLEKIGYHKKDKKKEMKKKYT